MRAGEDKNFDAIIVGGGIIGLSIARELKKRGIKRVAIIEKHSKCGQEASAAAAGMLAPQAETDNADDFFRFCQQSRDIYPHFAEELFAETGVDIELDQTGTLYLAFDEDDLNELDKRYEWQRAANLPVEKLNEWDISALEPNVSSQAVGGLRFPLDWQVENKKTVRALTEWAWKYEVKIIHDDAKSLIYDKGKIIGVKTWIHECFAPVVVVALGAWSSQINYPEDIGEFIKVAPIKGQMLAFVGDYSEDKLFQHVIYSPRGYIVPRQDKKVLVGATVENVGFQYGVTGAGLASLLETAFEISPHFRKMNLRKYWAGLRPKTLDGLPLLGEFPKNSGLYFATGHYRNGILLAPLTAKLIADKIVDGADSPFLQIFNPSRFQR